MTEYAAMERAPRVAGPAAELPSCPLQRSLSSDESTAASGDVFSLKLRLKQLENENLALKIQVNQLIMSLSKTLLREAVKS